MRIAVNTPASAATLTAALEGLTALNTVMLGRVHLPPLYKSGVRYRREPPGREQWLRADETFRQRFGDCEDLASWRAAELRRRGVPAIAVAKRTGPRRYHAVVRFPDGTYEDPSKMLGMR